MDFSTWYTTKHGYAPFPWQLRLAGQVQNGQWPEEITLPTGTGKTSVVDIWAWAHDARISGVPTRLCYVIDRRLVVDSVTAHAESLGVNVVKMRGGMLPDDSWLMDPQQPTVIVSTVDQVGSRLLWRGYGISARVTPVHAGLIGNDTLIVLDEAHISTPFATTLEGIKGYQQDTLRLPWQVVRMTATPTGDNGFSLDQDDQAHPVLKPRLEARRLASLDSASEDVFISKMVNHVQQLRADGAQVVGVVCNTVNDARSVFARLQGDKVLLTGRIRPADKDVILAEYLPRMVAGSRSKGREMLYVVATQTIEVGADLDFDALVTERAPIDSLRQRFGRVDRLGELGTSQSVIVRKRVTKDFVYGITVLRDAWKWLNGIATGKGKNKTVDWGLLAMNTTVSENPPPLRPLPETKPLLPTDIRRLRQTEPRVEMDITPWLHGVNAGSATVQVAWRVDIASDNVDQWPGIMAATPPVVAEMMPCPVGAVRRWLGNRVALANERIATAREIRPGDTLVVPSTYGGYDHWGWAPNSGEAVTDIGNVVERKRTRIRLHPALYPDMRVRSSP